MFRDLARDLSVCNDSANVPQLGLSNAQPLGVPGGISGAGIPSVGQLLQGEGIGSDSVLDLRPSNRRRYRETCPHAK